MKYLLDEMLSPVVALDEERVVITMNAGDFLTLAEDSEVHAGLVVLRQAGLSRDEQRSWVRAAIVRLAEEKRDLVNRVVEVTGVGKYTIRTLPPTGPSYVLRQRQSGCDLRTDATSLER